MKKIIQRIFSVKNENEHKVWRILGLKIALRNNRFYQKMTIDKLDEISRTLECRFYENKIRQQKMFSVYNLHQQVFPQFKNKHINESIVIVGCGPTLNYYEPIKNVKHIGLNRALDFEKIKFDYNFWVDSNYDGRYYIKKYANYNCIKFYRQHNLNIQPYYGENGCSNIPDCDAIRDNAYRFYSNAHDYDIFPDISTYPLFDFGSVAHCAFQFALWTNPKKIYLIGCDCANNGYYNGKTQPKWDLLNKAIQGYCLLADFVKIYYPDIEIISVNPVGLKGIFKDVYTQSYIDAHPELKEENIEIINEEGLCKDQ